MPKFRVRYYDSDRTIKTVDILFSTLRMARLFGGRRHRDDKGTFWTEWV